MIDRLYRLTHVSDELDWDQIHYIKVAGVFMIWSAGITISIIVESILLIKNYNTREIIKTILLDCFNRLIFIFKLAYNKMKFSCYNLAVHLVANWWRFASTHELESS